MNESLEKMLQMAEWLKAHGERELAAECRRTAARICDVIMFLNERRAR